MEPTLSYLRSHKIIVLECRKMVLLFSSEFRSKFSPSYKQKNYGLGYQATILFIIDFTFVLIETFFP